MNNRLERRVEKLECEYSQDDAPVFVFVDLGETQDEALARYGVAASATNVTFIRWLNDDEEA